MPHDIQQLSDYIKTIDLPQPGSIWQHYKGDLYKVISVCVLESTEELAVCYSAEDGSFAYPWVRSLKEWRELVEYNNHTFSRFTELQNL